jgi:A/G-specific adenine glycosylase
MIKTDSLRNEQQRVRAALQAWYARGHRDLPWRRTADPYAIWVSEIMLQQTRVAVVEEKFLAFMKCFPTLQSLAAASEQEVLALWSGLGYYRRARMLHQAARQVAELPGSCLPTTAKALRLLPGIGAYTAAAIASIAHGEAVAVVDGNVERVLCRLRGWEADGSSELRRRIEGLAAELVDPAQPGDFNQAMMELGAMVCTPRSPACAECPLLSHCATRGEHKTQARPPMRTQQAGCALVLRQNPEFAGLSREVLLEQRSESETVMPGMWELPALKSLKVPSAQLHMTVRHAIMQVNYNVHVHRIEEDRLDQLIQARGTRSWISLREAGSVALTGLARKVLTRSQLLYETESRRKSG